MFSQAHDTGTVDRDKRTVASFVTGSAFALLLFGCAGGGNQTNPAYFKNGRWSGVSGGALVQNPIICRSSRAKDANEFGDAIKESLIPRLFTNIGVKAPSTDVLEANSSVCKQLSSIRKSTLEVSAPMRATATSSIAACPTCTSMVVPYFYVNDVAVVAELKDRNGTVLATTETDKREADGEVYARILVFTKSGDVMFYGASDYVVRLGIDGLRSRAPALVEQMLVSFPREVLTGAHTADEHP